MQTRHFKQHADYGWLPQWKSRCCSSWISVADRGEVFVVDAMVGRAHQASDGVVDDSYVGGVYLRDTNICADVAARVP